MAALRIRPADLSVPLAGGRLSPTRRARSGAAKSLQRPALVGRGWIHPRERDARIEDLIAIGPDWLDDAAIR